MAQTENKTAFGALALSKLFDNGNYTEIGAHVMRNGSSDEREALVCAYGPVGDRLVFAFAQDMERMSGAFDAKAAKKIEKFYELALKSGAPVVGVFASSGSVVTEGSALLSGLSAMLTSVAMASDELPQIALVGGVCTGCMATAASMFDFTVTVKGAEFSAAAGTLTDGKGAQASIVAESEDAAFDAVRSLVAALPDNCDCGPAIADETDLNRVTGITEDEAKDKEKLIPAISDDGSFIELWKDDSEMTVGFAPVAGRYVGIVSVFGELTAKGANKAAGMTEFCSSFSIPVITLINSNGIAMSADAESAGLAKACARLAKAYRASGSPRISAGVGNACGAALPLMGSKYGASDVSFALKNSVIAPLDPARGVAFLMNSSVSADTPREKLESDYADSARAEKAAFDGDIDFVVSIDELRARICGALFMLDRE